MIELTVRDQGIIGLSQLDPWSIGTETWVEKKFY